MLKVSLFEVTENYNYFHAFATRSLSSLAHSISSGDQICDMSCLGTVLAVSGILVEAD